MLSALAAALALLAIPAPAPAHEVRPAIADVEVTPDRVRMDVRVAVEALVAGIDLDGLADTNDSPLAGEYDRLRALKPAELERVLRAAWPRLSENIRIEVAGRPLSPDLDTAAVPEVGDLALARDSVLSLSAALPPGDDPVTIGWAAEYGPLVVRQMNAGENAYTAYLTKGDLSAPLPRVGTATEAAVDVARRYLVLGFEHIVPKGLDHILFVLGLFFLSQQLRPLLIQVSAFTVAHTLTLALAMLGLVQVPATIVEPLIAASIVYVAVENVLHAGLSRWRTLVVFCFGLLHGLGFASVLGEIGLDPARFLVGLVSFNIGVELGQLAVILAAWLLVGMWFRSCDWYRARIAMPASIAIACIGGYWFFERVIG